MMDKNPYRAPESDLPPTSKPAWNDDDVIRQPGTMAAALLAVALIFGMGLLYLSSTYGPSRVVEVPTTQPAPQTN
jgi:hypothetical protein